MLRSARVPLLIAALIATAVIAFACGGDDSPSGGSGGAPASQGAGQVNIIDFGFGPNTLTAKAGQAVSLNVTNTGREAHTFTIVNLVDSGTLSAGQSKALTFTPATAGTLTFLCTIHGAGVMSGTLTVSQ